MIDNSMFAKKYINHKNKYYRVELSRINNTYEIRTNRVSLILKSPGEKDYSRFLRVSILSSFLTFSKGFTIPRHVEKKVITQSRKLLKKRDVNDFISILLSTKHLLIKRIRSFDKNSCVSIQLQDLGAFPVIEGMVSRSFDVRSISLYLNFVSQDAKWTVESIIVNKNN